MAEWAYWNRDRWKQDGAHMAWHASCFPVRLPETWEVLGHGAKDADEFLVEMFGGAEHMAELETDPKWSPFYPRAIARWREQRHDRVTPAGYACGPVYGAPCAACGKPC